MKSRQSGSFTAKYITIMTKADGWQRLIIQFKDFSIISTNHGGCTPVSIARSIKDGTYTQFNVLHPVLDDATDTIYEVKFTKETVVEESICVLNEEK